MAQLIEKIERKYIFVFWALQFICIILFLPTIFGQPFWDDWTFLFNRERYQFGYGPFAFFPLGLFPKAWPIFYSIFWFLIKFFKDQYFLYHLLSLFLHALNSFLIYIIFKKINLRHSFLLALMFLVHPLHLFTISWIIQLKTILSIFFFLISIIFIFNSINKQKILNLLLFFLFYSLSVFSKATTASFIAVAILFVPTIIKFHFLNKKTLLSFFILSTLIAGLSVFFTIKNNKLNFNKVFNPDELILQESAKEYLPNAGDRILISLKNVVRYSIFALLPIDPPILHQQPTTLSYSTLDVLFLLFFSVFIFFLIKYLKDSNNTFLLVAFIFFLITILPFSGFIYIPIFNLYNFVPYWLSIPLLGFIPLFSLVKSNVRLLKFYILMLAFVSHFYSYNFFNTESLFIKSVKAEPENINYRVALIEHYIFTRECAKASDNYKEYIQSLGLEIKTLMLKVKKCE